MVEAQLPGMQPDDIDVNVERGVLTISGNIESEEERQGRTYLLRERRSAGPFRNLMLGQRHIHHFVPAIVMAFASGAGAIVTSNERVEPYLALAFGTGMGLTLDESALLLELDDVYWSQEGVLSIQIALAAMSLMSATALGVRFLRRGEAAVLDAPR